MTEPAQACRVCHQDTGVATRGFTLIELLAVLTIAALLLVAAMPSTMRLYDSLQYRQAVREVLSLLGSARYLAVNSGKAQDVVIDPRSGELWLNDEQKVLPGEINLVVRTAKEINRDSKGVIRFYPEGGSSGGDIELEGSEGNATRISVDWLVGSVSHARYTTQ